MANCKKGVACGNACIPKSRKCRKGENSDKKTTKTKTKKSKAVKVAKPGKKSSKPSVEEAFGKARKSNPGAKAVTPKSKSTGKSKPSVEEAFGKARKSNPGAKPVTPKSKSKPSGEAPTPKQAKAKLDAEVKKEYDKLNKNKNHSSETARDLAELRASAKMMREAKSLTEFAAANDALRDTTNRISDNRPSTAAMEAKAAKYAEAGDYKGLEEYSSTMLQRDTGSVEQMFRAEGTGDSKALAAWRKGESKRGSGQYDPDDDSDMMLTGPEKRSLQDALVNDKPLDKAKAEKWDKGGIKTLEVEDNLGSMSEEDLQDWVKYARSKSRNAGVAGDFVPRSLY